MQRPATIAIIDDEMAARESLSLALSAAGYAVKAFADGRSALEALQAAPPDAIVLDVLMPVMDGIAFCRHWRQMHPATPIVFASSLGRESDKIEALEQGGDDYVVKPYSIPELLTRIRVCLHRLARLGGMPTASAPEEIRASGLVLRPESWEAEYEGHPIAFTVTEFRMLRTLALSPGRAYDRDSLIAQAYPDDAFVADRNVDAHIRRIRKKLRALDPGSEVIETVHGVGYRFRIPGKA